MLTPEILIQIALSFVVFVVFYRLFSPLVARPFIALLEEREARTSGDEHAAQQSREHSGVTGRRIEEGLRHARLEGIRHRDERIARARESAHGIHREADEKAAESLERARLEIQRLKREALRDVEIEAKKFADLMAQKAVEPNSKPVIH